MTKNQWSQLVSIVNGEPQEKSSAGFIIDSPWLPGWAGMTVKEYFDDGEKWFDANLKAMSRFPDTIFIPGFWAEYGMCTEPSAFGCECVWHEDDLPFAEKVIDDIQDIRSLKRPDPSKDGLTVKVIERLKKYEPRIIEEGHEIKFAVSRGPLNLASFLMGNTEFLMALITDPDEAALLLDIVTDFIVDWVRLQKKNFPSIEGILILDDIVGFIGDDQFKEFAFPRLKKIYDCIDADVKAFHNDAPGLVCAPYLSEIGINLFNFAFEHSMTEMKELAGNKVALLGNLPPRDVLAAGTPEEVKAAASEMAASIDGRQGVLFSCGGGMPPDATTENIEAFISAVC